MENLNFEFFIRNSTYILLNYTYLTKNLGSFLTELIVVVTRKLKDNIIGI